MTKKSPASRLTALVRSRVNQVAHRLGQAHEVAQRATLLARLNTVSAAGATPAELNALIDELEAPAHMGANHAS